MEMNINDYVLEVIAAVCDAGTVKATKFVAPNKIVRATRRTFGGKINKRGNIEILLSIGKPNFAEREMVKVFKKRKEAFPIIGMIVKGPKKAKK